MNTVDLLVVVVLLLNGLIGAFRGFVWQVFRIGSLILAFVFGSRFGSPFSAWLGRFLDWDQSARTVLAYVLIILATYAVMLVLGHLLRSVLERASLGSADRSLGFVLGGLKGAAIVVVIFQILLMVHDYLPEDVQHQLTGNKESGVAHSRAFALHTKWMADSLRDLVPPDVQDRVVEKARQFQSGR